MSKRLVFAILFAGLLIQSAAFGQPTPTTTQQSAPSRDSGNVLIEGLRKIDGCIAVDSCRWQSGRQSIVAWFKNKAAVVRWYYSDVHQAMVGGRTDGTISSDEPLKHVTDENGPIMVIATLTPSDRPELPGINMSIKQISIELFAPLPGGAHVNGRISPEAFVVPHMRDYSPAKSESPGEGK